MPKSSADGSAESESKRARLTSLRRGSFVSHAAIEALMRDARDNGIPNAFSKTTQWRARVAEATRPTAYGPLVQPLVLLLDDGAECTAAVQHPLAMLSIAAAECEAFSDLLRATLAKHPPSPARHWRIVIYIDEVGFAPLKHDSRKTQSFYWSFLEFGVAALLTEKCWFTVSAVRSTVIQELSAGMSHFCKLVLRTFFAPDGHDLRTSGMPLKLFGDNGPTTMLFADLGVFISDEKAIKELICNKGASGTKCCPLCINVVAHDSGLPEGYLKLSSCTNVAEFKLHTDETVRTVVHRLASVADEVAAGSTSNGTLKLLEQQLGWTHEPDSLLLDAHLAFRAVSCLMFDWMHIYLVSGLFNVELHNLMQFMKPFGITYDVVHAFLLAWKWPRHLQSPADTFDDGAQGEKDVTHFKCSASQGLSLYSVLSLFFSRRREMCTAQIDSFLALCDVLDLLLCTVRDLVSADLLESTIFNHLDLFQLAYGLLNWLHKHHMSTHLGPMLRQFGCLLSCFVHERRHKLVKRYGQDRKNTTNYEAGLVQECTLQHLHDMKSQWIASGLHDPIRPRKQWLEAMIALHPTAVNIMTSRVITVAHSTFTAGDVVLVHVNDALCVGEVWFHVSIDGNVQTCVSLWEPVPASASATAWVKTYRKRERPLMLESSHLREALVYLESARGESVSVLIPPAYR